METKSKPSRASRKPSLSNAPLTQLKQLWLETLTESEKDYWREQLRSARQYRELRAEIAEKYHIELSHESGVGKFRQWVPGQDAREAEAEQVEADTAELRKQGLSGEQLRDELLKRMKERALARGDFKLGAVAVKLDLQAATLALSREKFKAGQRAKLAAGLAELAKQINRNPKARAAYEALKAEVKAAKR